VTQADVDAGQIVNTASARGLSPAGVQVTATDTQTTLAVQSPSIAVGKNSPTESFTAGAVVTYTFDVVNTGDVTLSGVTVNDEIVGLVVCPTTTLAPGAATTCSGDYTVTQADIDAGTRNTRSARALRSHSTKSLRLARSR